MKKFEPASRSLKISAERALPLEAVTQTFAILGIRGSGKTNSGVDMAEEMLKAGQQIVVLDPVDVWWGLRSSRDGAHAGFPIAIIGGEHGDVPLEGVNGTVIADFVVDSGTPVVLSLRHLSLGDQRRFAADFAERLYHRKGEGGNRGPLHLFVDECDEFIPQNIQKRRRTDVRSLRPAGAPRAFEWDRHDAHFAAAAGGQQERSVAMRNADLPPAAP